MVDVTRDNFTSLLDQIKGHISQSAFVSFDCEFTALFTKEPQFQITDTPEVRYRKSMASSEGALISQVGLSCFIYDQEANKFDVYPYNFYLCPRSIAGQDPRFVMQASSLEFLFKHCFDFNTFLGKGISYLDEEQEAELRGSLSSGTLIEKIESALSNKDKNYIKDLCVTVSNWLAKAKDEETLPLNTAHIDHNILHVIIRKKFNSVWTYIEDGQFGVIFVSAELRKSLVLDDSIEDTLGDLITDYLGFSQVIQHMASQPRPLVGHNCWQDLIRIYRQFIRPLPSSLSQFKKDLTTIFPVIFDTKHMSNSMADLSTCSKRLSYLLGPSDLVDLHTKLVELGLASEELKGAIKLYPITQLAPGFKRYAEKDRHHEAGYDAYVSGECFILLGCLASGALKDNSRCGNRVAGSNRKPGQLPQSTTDPIQYWHDICASMEFFKNRINFQRAAVHHINLCSADTVAFRYSALHVSCLNGNNLDLKELEQLVRRNGSAEIEIKDGGKVALVVFTSKRDADRFITNANGKFNNLGMKVEKFQPAKHDSRVRRLLWLGAATSATLSMLVFRKALTEFRSM